MKKYLSRFGQLLGVLILFTSCNVTKKIQDGQYYLKSNDYEFVGDDPFASELENYVTQKPNKKTLGLPFADWAYNQVPEKYDSVFADYYSYSFQERNQALLDSFYRKYNLPEEVGKGKWLTRQFYRNGAKPITLDTVQSHNSANELEEFYFERGYFDANVEPTFEFDEKAKKAEVTYNVEVNEPSKVVQYDQVIENSILENLYAKNVADSKVKLNERYDVRNFTAERDRLSKIFKNNGFYKFNEFGNELIYKIDTTQNKELKATLKIAKPETDSIQYFKQYYIGDVEVQIAKLGETGEFVYDTVHMNYGIKSMEPLRLKPRVYTDAITIRTGDLYRDDDINMTKKLMLDRENFNLVSFLPKETTDSVLNFELKLRPKEKYDIEVSFEGSYSELLQFGISPGVRLLTRNIFSGGENLEVGLRGTVGTVNNTDSDRAFFNAYELSFETKLNFPRWLLPIETEGLVPKSWNPKSAITLGLSGQRNIGLGIRNYSATLDYTWTPKRQTHKFELLNFQYVRNTQADKYYRIFTVDREIRDETFASYFDFNPTIGNAYESGEISDNQVESIIYGDNEFIDGLPRDTYTFDDYTNFRNVIFRKNSITQNVLIQSFSHAYTYNETTHEEFDNPWFIYAKAEVAGALMRLMDATFTFKHEDNFYRESQSLLGGVPYSEFARIDLDVRKTFNFGNRKQLALRSFTGIAYPYGNINSLPFSKSYFAGGSNDVRAWQAYELSPAPLRPNDDGTYIDQMKITWNAEYRFPISGMFLGALFVDAGNIWSVNNTNPRTQFKWNQFLSQMGVGSGFGLRFDFTFIIARLDFAYKLHDPAYPSGDRWFQDIKILRPQWQFGINYPF